MSTAWANLPNVRHIDAVLEHLKQNPQRWGTAWDAARGAAWDAAWSAAWDATWDAARDAARDASWDAAWNAAWSAARDAAWNAAWSAAWSAIRALIAFDDCAHYLTDPPQVVATAAKLGVPAAALLYPACLAMEPR